VRKQEKEEHVNPGPYLGAKRCTTVEQDNSILNAIRENGQSGEKAIFYYIILNYIYIKNFFYNYINMLIFYR